MAHRVLSTLAAFLLLIAVARGSEPDGSRQFQDGDAGLRRGKFFGGSTGSGKNADEAASGSALTPATPATNTTEEVFPEDTAAGDHPPESGEEEHGSSEGREENSGEEYGAEEEEGGEDEYEDELRAVAESHEAMSKDDARNSNSSSSSIAAAAAASSPSSSSPSLAAPPAHSVGGRPGDGTERPPPMKSFDSPEVAVVNDSDEDVASNEAITDEVVDKNDEEVAELLKYKKERTGEQTKRKRVPTVKKELSTQREILMGSNETQVPRSLVPSEDPGNPLNEEITAVERRSTGGNKPLNPEKGEREYFEGSEAGTNGRSRDKKKLDRTERLRELEAWDEAVAEPFVKFFVKLTENPRRWEYVQKLLTNAGIDLQPVRNTLDPAKRSYETIPGSTVTTAAPSEAIGKGRKKYKKKKKKPRQPKYQSTTSTTTTVSPVPGTPPLLTTTETPWQTTPVHWRLVAEKLFGPPWQQDLGHQQDDPEKEGKVRYSVASKPRTLPAIRGLMDQGKAKGGLKPFNAERKSLITEPREIPGQNRLLRYVKINNHQPARLPGHRDFGNVYEAGSPSNDPDRILDYDVPEAYPRLRYNQLPPVSREILHRRREDDYQDDFPMQPDGFMHGPGYRSIMRDYPLSKSWPDVQYKYGWPWKPEERPLHPVPVPSGGKWPWRQPQTDLKYWPQRGKYVPPEMSYWPGMDKEEDLTERERQRVPDYFSERERANSWLLEIPLQLPPSWQHPETPVKPYDREQSREQEQWTGVWDRSKNRSELDGPSLRKEEEKPKVALPQITMRTWNSLTSDPATWPYKLPGAKPWPKDENGKSYNPNADLVKKLGLDKQNNGWTKETTGKSYETDSWKKSGAERTSTAPGNDSSREDEFPRSRYRPSSGRNGLTDYKSNPGADEPSNPQPWSIFPESKAAKEWPKARESGALQTDELSSRNRKYDSIKNSWLNKSSLPKIQSVGAWVMPADQSTWKPYQIKPLDSAEEDSPDGRRWPGSRAGEETWSGKDARPWTEKANDAAWMEESRSGVRTWPERAGKPSSWFGKPKDVEDWPSKSSGESWMSKTKGDPSWLAKPNESRAWSPKIMDNNSWTVKSSHRTPWSTKTNESGSWSPKPNLDGKFPAGDGWPVKSKEPGESWRSKSSEVPWKSNDASWQRKSDNDQTGWTSGKSNDLGSWQQKMHEEWNVNYGKSPGTTWPSKWKQFAYHRVTAMPISKPGTTADSSASKSKNAFVAVSAVSSPKYAAGENAKPEDQDRLSGSMEQPIYAWKKDGSSARTSSPGKNGTDPLENQLEALRQIDFWPYKENEAEKDTASTSPPRSAGNGSGNSNSNSDSDSNNNSNSTPSSSTTRNTTQESRLPANEQSKLPETHRQAIPMK